MPNSSDSSLPKLHLPAVFSAATEFLLEGPGRHLNLIASVRRYWSVLLIVFVC